VSRSSPALDTALVESTLEADRRRTDEALRRRLDTGTAGLDELLLDYPSRGGRGLRPSLCLATCRAFGGRSEDAVDSAVAIELIHNAFLVHDDICDDSLVRRGRPSLHARAGIPRALVVGDALAWTALDPLFDNLARLGTRLGIEVLREFRHLTQRTIRGQLSEMDWRDEGLEGIDADAYLAVALDKTCWYSTIHPCRIGALIGSRGRADLEPVARYGFFLGAMFQVVDDVANVLGGAGYDKDPGGDLLEGKPTILLAHLLGVASPEERAEVLALVGPDAAAVGRPAPEERVARVRSLLQVHGSIGYALEFVDGLAGAALAEHAAAFGHLPPAEDVEFLRALVLHLRR
jgi:geranylgeranyl diphosphate synthase type II